MLIVCPSCATTYDVQSASLEPNGRQVRCVRCRTVWRAEATRADKLAAAAVAISPERRAAAVPAEAPVAMQRPGHAPNEWSIEERFLTGPAAEPAPANEKGAPLRASSDTVAVEGPPIVPGDLGEDRPPIDIAADHPAEDDTAARQDIETYAARHRRRGFERKRSRRSMSRLHIGILALVVIDSILIGWRGDIVRALPQTASFYALMGLSVNVRGLGFEGTTTAIEQHEGVPILVVEGNITNDTRRIVDVPRLIFAVRNVANQEIYSWTAVPPRTMLPPGEAVSFRSRLASPPPEGRDVLVRFVNRHDVLTGVH